MNSEVNKDLLMEYGGGFSDASDQETIAKSGKLAWHQNELSKMKWNCKHCKPWQDKKAQLGRMLLSQAGNQAVRAKSLAELGCELEAFKPPKAKAMGGQGWRHKGSRGWLPRPNAGGVFVYLQ